MIIRASLVVADATGRVFAPGAFRIGAGDAAGRIVEIGPAAQVQPGPGEPVVDFDGGWIIPGLVQGHIHFGQTLFRGLAEGLDLLPWLKDRIWPMEAAHNPASVRASARQSIVELLQSGATAALTMETSYHSDAVFQAAYDLGIRAVIGPALMDFEHKNIPPRLIRQADEALSEVVELDERWSARSGGRIRACLAPRFVLSCSEDLMQKSGAIAEQRGLIWHTHASENARETAKVKEITGDDNVAYFARLGLLSERASLAHGVWLTDEEVQMMAAAKANLLHCPSTNLKLGSGVADTAALSKAGVAIAIGSDGAPANNRLDVFSEMRLAGLLAQWKGGPGAVSAGEVFRWATAGGAAALGMAADIGTLDSGKYADFVVLEPGGFAGTLTSAEDVYTHLVFGASSQAVRETWIGGTPLVQAGKLIAEDAGEIHREFLAQRQELLRRL